METPAVLVVEAVGRIGLDQLDLGSFRQIGRLVAYETPTANARRHSNHAAR